MAIPAAIIDGIENLDPLPTTAQRLTALLSDEDIAFDEIIEVVEHDQAVAVNVMREANSLAMGSRFKIESLRSAAVRLGKDRLLEIALGSHVKSLSIDAPMYDLREDELWLHGATAALAVRRIISEFPDAGIPASASLAALVHDIGKLIIVRYLQADVEQLLTLCDENDLAFVEAERDLLGCDHAEVGALMGEAWALPTAIVDAIRRHHRVPVEDSSPMLDAVLTANFVCRSIGIGIGAAGMNIRVDEGCLTRLGLSFEDFCRICADTHEESQTLRN